MAVLSAIGGSLIGSFAPMPPSGIAASAVLTSALLFFGLRWLFDAGLWRWTGMPDIGGRWAYDCAALNTDGSILYPWTATATIAQSGAVITISVETAKSRSISRGASLRRATGGGVTLLYDYESDPDHDATASHAFFGVTRFMFDTGLRAADGTYFNYNGRYTFGRIRLTRI